MIIEFDQNDLFAWTECVPVDGDLIFLTDSFKSQFDKNVSVMPAQQFKDQYPSLWNLNSKSWFGYALNRADYCTWLPKGVIEGFDSDLQAKLVSEQVKLQVPTIINQKWITSLVWSESSIHKRAEILKGWFQENDIQIYQSLKLEELSASIQSDLKRMGLDRYLNRFAHVSGPNCLAAVSFAMTSGHENINRWMHFLDFEEILYKYDYQVIETSLLQVGDVMTFFESEVFRHAAYYLGDGLYFEKPGQDFYEPYRIAELNKWQQDWPDSSLKIWRKTTSY